MEFNKVESIIKRLSYKPGWTLLVEHHIQTDRFRFTLSHKAEDATGIYTGYVPVTLQKFLCPDMIPDESYLMMFLRQMFLDMEHHEFQEWFKLDGVPVENPHPERSI